MDEQKRKYHIRLLLPLLGNAANDLKEKSIQSAISDSPWMATFAPTFSVSAQSEYARNDYLWRQATRIEDIQNRLLALYKTKGAGLNKLPKSDIAMLIPIMWTESDTFDLIPEEDWNEIFKELLDALYPKE